jgi:deazaflavin-dependent oxidoreductase (nitroreductase family)
MHQRGIEVVDLVKDTLNNTSLDPKVAGALARGGVIDITTIGRRSGKRRRIEIVFHNIGGRIFISGMPMARRRSWLQNLDKNPQFTFHLKGAVRADLAATARVIDEEAERRTVLPPIARAWRRNDLNRMVRESPLIEVTLDGVEALPKA